MAGKIFVSHSSKGDQRGRRLRRLVLEGLQARNRDVFLDEDDLDPGDLWRPKIYRALAECEGAVLLLSPEAMASEWVQAESTILTWRRDLRAHFRRPLRVVAVLLSGVTQDDVARSAFYARLKLDEAEFLVEPFGPEEDVAELAERIAGAFPPLALSTTDTMWRWVENVASWLGKIDTPFLDRAAVQLNLPKEDWELTESRFNLAAALLCWPFEQVEQALWELLPSRALNTEDLLLNVAPASFPYPSTAGVVEALRRPPGNRVVALNAAYEDTAKRLTMRATCCDSKFLMIDAVAAQTVDGAYEEIAAKIARWFRSPRRGRFDPALLAGNPNVQVVVVLQRLDNGVGLTVSVLADVVRRLRQDFGVALFVVAAGTDPVDLDTLGIRDALVVEPPLRPGEEDALDEKIYVLTQRFFPQDSRVAVGQ